MNNTDNFYFAGTHIIWWILWSIVLIWFFAGRMKGYRKKTKNKDTKIRLKNQLASGQIEIEEYLKKIELLKLEIPTTKKK